MSGLLHVFIGTNTESYACDALVKSLFPLKTIIYASHTWMNIMSLNKFKIQDWHGIQFHQAACKAITKRISSTHSHSFLVAVFGQIMVDHKQLVPYTKPLPLLRLPNYAGASRIDIHLFHWRRQEAAWCCKVGTTIMLVAGRDKPSFWNHNCGLAHIQHTPCGSACSSYCSSIPGLVVYTFSLAAGLYLLFEHKVEGSYWHSDTYLISFCCSSSLLYSLDWISLTWEPSAFFAASFISYPWCPCLWRFEKADRIWVQSGLTCSHW